MKDRLNVGETGEMYFYRDSEGNEVDLLLPTGGKMHAIEIKAGGCVVFGGTQGQHRSDWPVHSWLQLQTKPA